MELVARTSSATPEKADYQTPTTAAETVEAQPLPASPADGVVLPSQVAAATKGRLQDTAGTTNALARYATELPKHSIKNESLGEWRPEYRTPKHRLAERGGRLRRVRNSITKHWQQLFGPRRSSQPAS